MSAFLCVLLLPMVSLLLHGCSTTPSTPTQVQTQWHQEEQVLRVAWTCSTENNAYEIQIAESADADPFAVQAVMDACSVDLGLDFLLPNTTYFLRLRSHGRDTSSLSVGVWSPLSVAMQVKTGGGEARLQVRGLDSSTFSLEVFRFSEFTSNVDYLGNHDSSDIAAGAHWMTKLATDPIVDFANTTFNDTTWTLYCVDLKVVELKHNLRFVKDSRFADYLSCNYWGKAQCSCPPENDVQSGQDSCRGNNTGCFQCASPSDCHEFCPAEAMDDSRLYTGRQDMYWWSGFQTGSWYSHPRATECPVGSKIGTDCNWMMHSRALVTKGKRLLEAGLRPSKWSQPDIVAENIEVIKKAFADLPLQPWHCTGPVTVV